MQLNVYKASAGSGKTYRLSVEYIKLLMLNPYGYRHILAVTFTNKATEEMKTRILGKLYAISHRLPDGDSYLKTICKEMQMDPETVIKRSSEALHNILHEYNYFRIETIDAFFQQVLRNLARELKLSNTLRLQVDDKQILNKAVDRMLDDLNEKSAELLWIVELINDQIDQEKQWNIVGDIKEFGKKLLENAYRDNEKNITLATEGNPDNPKGKQEAAQSFQQFRKHLEELKTSAQELMSSYADRFDQLLNEHVLTIEDLKGKKSGPGGYFGKLRNLELHADDTRNKTIEKALLDPKEFLSKEQQKDATLCHIAETELHTLLVEAEEARQRCLKIVVTATKIIESLGKIRLLTSINRKIKELNAANDIFLLSDTQSMLSKLIADSDSPFIFEKIGSTLTHIMIDEFQDTSSKQWQNFKVLLNDCMANEDSTNLIVGDVKQSIYRWRDGDWRLLNNIEDHFAGKDIEIESLKKNFRSSKTIIDFNNAFFLQAVENEAAYLESDHVEGYETLKKIYADVRQDVSPSATDDGYVKVESFTHSADATELMLSHLAADLLSLQEQKVPLKDIAIIVRQNKDIQEIVEYLTREHPSLPLITAEALLLSSSVAVNMMVDAFRTLVEKNYDIVYATLAYNYQRYMLGNENFSTDALADKEQIGSYLPEAFVEQHDTLCTMPLIDLFEFLFQAFQLEKLNQQSAYVCTFFDALMDYTNNQGGDVIHFMNYWEDTLSNKSIQSDAHDGIHLLTVHKSKGLEFKHVFAPYCDWQLERDSLLWFDMPTQMQSEEHPISELLSPLPIKYSFNKLKNSYFKPSADEEHFQNLVDNLNILYVLFTRAKQSLYVYTREIKKGRRTTLLSDVLFNNENILNTLPTASIEAVEVGECSYKAFIYGTCTTGKSDDKVLPSSDNPFEQKPQDFTFDMKTYPFKGQYRQSNNSQQFIKSTLEETANSEMLPQPSYIDEGLLLHSIFALIRTHDDVQPVIQSLQLQGIASGSRKLTQKFIKFIEQRINSPKVAEWFSPSWKIMNECSIVYRDSFTGQVVERRPDRVLLKGDEVVVIDFKFGKQHDSYHAQVREYMRLMQQMGHPNVKGYLWYVYQNLVDEVKNN